MASSAWFNSIGRFEQIINLFFIVEADDDDDDDVPDLVENFDEVSKNEANAKTSRVEDDDAANAADDEDDEKSSPSALPTGKNVKPCNELAPMTVGQLTK